MLVKNVIVTLLSLAAVSEASTLHRSPFEATLARRQNKAKGGNNNNNNNNNNAATKTGNANANAQLCLDQNAIQTGSQSTGQANGVAADGQVNSAT
jgi:transcription initiation factor TFIID subunit 15